MAVVSTDRWTCPGCDNTTVAHGPPADVRTALAAVRDRHICGHGAAYRAALALGDPPPVPHQPTARCRRRGHNFGRRS